MRNFEVAFETLQKIFDNKIRFNLAVKSSLKKANKMGDSAFINELTSTCGCVLRHYYVFEEIIKRQYPDANQKQILLISLALANRLFSKRYDVKKLNEYVCKESELDDVTSFIEGLNDPKKLIPEDVKEDTPNYYHLRYNLPLWLVEMWSKNFDSFIAKKLFRSVYHKDKQILRINSNNIDGEEFFKKYNNLQPFGDSLAIYDGKENIKKLLAVKNGDAFDIDAGYKLMVNSIEIDPIRGIAVYAGSSNKLLTELYCVLGNSFKMDYLCGSQKNFFEVKKEIQELGMLNISTYEVSYTGIVTCISKPVHYFFLCPRNTYFRGLSETPDYFLNINSEDLDEIIKEEKEAINEAKDQIEDGGYLIYYLPTVSKNETRGVIHAFLKENPNFTIVREKQMLPFDKYKNMFYFAILKKGESND